MNKKKVSVGFFDYVVDMILFHNQIYNRLTKFIIDIFIKLFK
jgi:hypothetical protein